MPQIDLIGRVQHSGKAVIRRDTLFPSIDGSIRSVHSTPGRTRGDILTRVEMTGLDYNRIESLKP